MKEKNDIKIFIIPTIISILILISIILGILYVEYIRNLTSKNILKNLGELAKQEAENISDKMQEHKRILETIINQIDIKTEDEVFKKYNTNAGKDEFSRIAILYKDGKTSTSDGTVVDLSQDINYFFQTNEIQISKTRLSKVDKKEINIYSKKISWNNQEEVVILLVVETDKYENLFLQSIYNGKGIEYLITVNGEIIANSNKEENGINIFEKLKENNKNKINKNLKNIEKMEQEINKTLNGQMLYKEKDNNFYINELKKIKNDLGFIPVISIKKDFEIKSVDLYSIINNLQSKHNSIALRITDDYLEQYNDIFSKLRHNDYLMLDIGEQNPDSKFIEIDEFSELEIQSQKVILNSPRLKEQKNGDYSNGITNNIDTSLVNIIEEYGFDGYGDYMGLKDCMPENQGSRGIGNALALLYDYKINKFHCFINEDKNKGMTGYREVKKEILEVENELNPDMDCPAFAKIKSINCGNWSTWHNITAERYIHQIYKKNQQV